MSSNFLEQGTDTIKKAVQKDNIEQFDEALSLYTKGIQYLMTAVKYEKNEKVIDTINSKIKTYLKRAEDIKKSLHSINGYENEEKKNTNETHEKKGKFDKELYDRIESEILSTDLKVRFDDVIGLEDVKQALLEAVILPAQRPDIFVGPRAPPPGLLLFGPPGNGKTFIAKALASECKSTFFCVSSATLTSRYVGEGEKMVAALFQIARERAPSIIFIDEIDSLLTMRGGKDEQESSRRMKTQFLVELDGVQSGDGSKRVLLVGATNLPWQLDEAALRRFPRRIMVPRPDVDQRYHIIRKVLNTSSKTDKNGQKLVHTLSDKQIMEIAKSTNGYCASDIKNLCNDAAMGPIRDCGMDILNKKKVPPVTLQHFRDSLSAIKPSATDESNKKFIEWNDKFGAKIKLKSNKNKKNVKQVVHPKRGNSANNNNKKPKPSPKKHNSNSDKPFWSFN